MINYVNVGPNQYRETNKEVGWVMKDGQWWADYASNLEWHQSKDGRWIQRDRCPN